MAEPGLKSPDFHPPSGTSPNFPAQTPLLSQPSLFPLTSRFLSFVACHHLQLSNRLAVSWFILSPFPESTPPKGMDLVCLVHPGTQLGPIECFLKSWKS